MVLKRITFLSFVALVSWPTAASAERLTTREALDRLSEVIDMRISDGVLRREELVPAMVVSLQVRYEESQGWFPTEGLNVLIDAFGADQLRVCEACMTPRTFARQGILEHRSGPIGLDEVIRLDTNTRGTAEPAKAAIWLDEHESGVSLKIIDLGTGRVLFAENIDPALQENADTQDLMRVAEDLERRQRGDSLTHAFVDLSLLPAQHFSLDWTDQWGETNRNFTGFTLSFFDPVVGLGLAYYRVFDIFTVAGIKFAPQIGGKIIMSLPTAIVEGLAPDDAGDLIDPLATAVLVVRLPLGSSNYAIVATASTNARIGIGISLLNISLLPVIP